MRIGLKSTQEFFHSSLAPRIYPIPIFGFHLGFSLGIPAGAVYFEEERVIVLAGKDSVTAKWRPLVGGVKHKADRFGPDCTIGFVTRRGSLDGLVVPSHCTNEEMDFGGPDEANIHQPQRP